MKIVNATNATIEEHSYDAWGNHRDPVGWGLANFSSSLGISRGYTGHEMLPLFQLINMNGRMYDPIIGRVLAPDNFVQNPRNAQNFNRYSYALNNPLRFTDPSGHKWKWWQWALLGIGLSDPATASATIVTTGVGVAGIAFGAAASSYVTTALNAPIMIAAGWCFNNYDGKNAVRNSWRINNGLFVTDPNKNFWGQTWEFTSRFTWEALQTVVGYVYTQGRNFGGNVDRVEYWGGATFAITENVTDFKGWRGVSLSNYINVKIAGVLDENYPGGWIYSENGLFFHEYGHTLQSKIFGLSYLFAVGIPSASGAEWTEIRANKRVWKYLQKYGLLDEWVYPDYPLE